MAARGAAKPAAAVTAAAAAETSTVQPPAAPVVENAPAAPVVENGPAAPPSGTAPEPTPAAAQPTDQGTAAAESQGADGEGTQPAAKTLVVLAGVAILRSTSGADRYLYQGAAVDKTAYTKESVKHALTVGLIGRPKQ